MLVQFHLDSDFASVESVITLSLSLNALGSIHLALEKAGFPPFPKIKDRLPAKTPPGSMVHPRDYIQPAPLKPLHTWETPCGKKDCGTFQLERPPCGALLNSMNAHSRDAHAS